MGVRLVDIWRLGGELRTEINPNAVTLHREGTDIVCELVRCLAERWNLSEELMWRMTVQRREELACEKIEALA